MKQKLVNRISSLQDKILDLKKVLANDTAASYKEASQTTEMIEVYERQVCNLRQEIANEDAGMTRYTLKHDNIELVYFLVEFGADPFKKWISKESPLGKQLKDSKLKDVINIGEKSYEVVKIETV